MKAAELHEKTDQELAELGAQLRDELFRMKLEHYTGQLQTTSELKHKRRDIARVETILRQRKIDRGEVEPKTRRNQRTRADSKVRRRRVRREQQKQR